MKDFPLQHFYDIDEIRQAHLSPCAVKTDDLGLFEDWNNIDNAQWECRILWYFVWINDLFESRAIPLSEIRILVIVILCRAAHRMGPGGVGVLVERNLIAFADHSVKTVGFPTPVSYAESRANAKRVDGQATLISRAIEKLFGYEKQVFEDVWNRLSEYVTVNIGLDQEKVFDAVQVLTRSTSLSCGNPEETVRSLVFQKEKSISRTERRRRKVRESQVRIKHQQMSEGSRLDPQGILSQIVLNVDWSRAKTRTRLPADAATLIECRLNNVEYRDLEWSPQRLDAARKHLETGRYGRETPDDPGRLPKVLGQ